MSGLSVQQLADAEEIRQLKARYCRLLDAKSWDGWRSVFSEDCVLEWIVESGNVEPVEGADQIVAFLRNKIMGRLTCHFCVGPEIEFTGPDSAVATWGAAFVHAGGVRRGYGHYRDHYRRVRGTWLIQRYRYDPLWVEVGSPAGVQVIPGFIAGGT